MKIKKYTWPILMAAAVTITACSSAEEPTSDETLTTQDESEEIKKNYGMVEVNPAMALSVEDMMEDFKANGQVEKEYTVQGEIEQVCAKMGCWVKIMNPEGDNFMVRFKDHFTIPTDTDPGTQAVLHGRAYVDTVSVDMLRHYAEDAGESEEEINKITEPEISFGFEADGIHLDL